MSAVSFFLNELFILLFIVRFAGRFSFNRRNKLSYFKLRYDELAGKALYHSTHNPYLGENLKVLDALDFIALAASFIPPQGVRLIRCFGLHSSRSRWKWPLWQHVAAHAPLGWKRTHEQDSTNP